MHGIQQRVRVVRSRQQWQWLWQCASWGLLLGGVAATAVAAMMVTETIGPRGWFAVAALLAVGPIAGLFAAVLWTRPLRSAAVQIDRSCGLKDRVATAWTFLSRPHLSSIQQLQIEDAEARSAAVDASRVVPLRVPRTFPLGVVSSGAAIALAFMAPGAKPVVAAVADPVVVSQAQRLDEELEQLQEFNQEDRDPEIEKLLEQLAETLEQLQQPGVDPKEALAKLSEMEAALEAQQQQLASPQMDAQMQQLGEALSLAEPLATAGQALEQGEFEKAAEEMERQDLPELDRQTERAVVEKLDQLKQAAADGAQRSLQEALGQASGGLSGANRRQFQEGMKGLAGQTRKHARRKKLASLLRQQCQSLSECKGECESACMNRILNANKGGSDWGTAFSGNEPGDKTAMLKTNKTLDIKGQESAEGDVDVETVQSSEQQQEAVREYREKVEKYEQLSESVLESEPIPLGHRQTIRRYFELIRPEAAEVDQVLGTTGQ
ncbi:MAG: hypothetical protein JNG89_03225 [Planctomycetaceae bacterium]|nr:hypothetical protein [Planctomycetaceae bacterium]